jgi:hypothetical protein
MNEKDLNKSFEPLEIIRQTEVIGSIFIYSLTSPEQKNSCEIEVTGYINKKYSGSNYYEVFLKLKEDIEENHDALVACYGSLKQFFVSGFSIDWSNGLKGYISNEVTLSHESVSPYKAVDANNYCNLVKTNEQAIYHKKFLDENRDRFIERNKILEAKVQKENADRGGVQSIKGFPK